jgi:hypothetical protein
MEGMAALREYYPALCAELITEPLFRDWTSLRLASDIVVVPFEPDITSRFSSFFLCAMTLARFFPGFAGREASGACCLA